MNNFGSFGNYQQTIDPLVKSLPANFLMIALVVLIVVVISFMLLQKSVLPDNPLPYFVPRSYLVYSASKLVWPPSGNARNLVAYKSDIGASFQDTSYSILMDCKLLDSRNNNSAPVHRHIFHRGSDEYSANPSAAANTAAGNLPRRMNPGVFLDPITNDLLVFVDTVNGSQSFRESLRIPDIPLKTPFRIGIIVSNRTLDVYINCRLEDTKLLQGTPKPVEMVVYGEAGPNPAPAQLQNVYLWTYAMTTADMTSLCRTPPSFVDSAAVCSTLPPPPAPNVAGSVNNTPIGNLIQASFAAGQNRALNTLLGYNRNVY